MSSKLPDGVGDLLANRIDSFEKLELVVALDAAPRSTMSVDDLCRVLLKGRDVIRQTAMELRAVALVELTSRGEVQLLPPTSQEHAALATLVQLYRDDRASIVRALGEISMARLRNMASHAFAEALVIKKKPPNAGDDG